MSEMKQKQSILSVFKFAPQIAAFIAVMLCIAMSTTDVYAQDAPDSPGVDNSAQSGEALPETPANPAKLKIVDRGNGRYQFSGTELDIRKALKTISTMFKRNIIASKGVQGTISIQLFSVSFEEAIKSIVTVAGLKHEKVDGIYYIFTQAEWAQKTRKMVSETFHLSYITAEQAAKMIVPILSKEGKASASESTSIGIRSERTQDLKTYGTDNVLVVRDYEANVDSIRTELKKIDIRPEQVMIEATILSVSLQDNDDLGVDLSILAGTTFGKVGATGNLSGVPNIPAGSIGGNKGRANFSNSFTLNFPQDAKGGLSFGFVSGNVAAFIRALERLRDITILANPKIMVLNKQQAQVHIGEDIGYIDSQSTTDTSTTAQVEFLQVGTLLKVMPVVGRDGNIRLEIHPEISSGQVTYVGNEQSGNALPNKTVTTLKSSVMVRDGRTLVIGGLFQEKSTRNRSQVPILGDLPGVGELLRYTGDASERDELIVLITPHIIRYPREEEFAKSVKERVENVRIGARKGLAWWSRVRLTDECMAQARKARAQGDVKKATWFADRAVALSPSRLDSMTLKQQLTKEANWHKEPANMSTRYLLDQMIKANDIEWEDKRHMPHLIPVKPIEEVEEVVELSKPEPVKTKPVKVQVPPTKKAPAEPKDQKAKPQVKAIPAIPVQAKPPVVEPKKLVPAKPIVKDSDKPANSIEPKKVIIDADDSAEPNDDIFAPQPEPKKESKKMLTAPIKEEAKTIVKPNVAKVKVQQVQPKPQPVKINFDDKSEPKVKLKKEQPKSSKLAGAKGVIVTNKPNLKKRARDISELEKIEESLFGDK